MLKIQPFGDRVIVKVICPEEKTEGSLLVKPVSKDKSNRGLVVAVGEGITLSDGTVKPISVKASDEVLFNLSSGTKISDGNDTYIILSSRDILGKVVKE